MKYGLALGLIALTFAACLSRRLPPGTPPPEYEPPIVTPWPAENADAGTDAGADAARGSADARSPAAAEPELSLDAGPR
ncbi:MAG: hypothetical protein WDO74_21405 [Pseudomonadota bacterium]